MKAKCGVFAVWWGPVGTICLLEERGVRQWHVAEWGPEGTMCLLEDRVCGSGIWRSGDPWEPCAYTGFGQLWFRFLRQSAEQHLRREAVVEITIMVRGAGGLETENIQTRIRNKMVSSQGGRGSRPFCLDDK